MGIREFDLWTVFFMLTIPIVMAYYLYTLARYHDMDAFFEDKNEIERKIGICGVEDEYY